MGDDVCVIERHWFGKSVGRKERRMEGVVASLGPAFRFNPEHGGHGVMAGIAMRVGVGVKLSHRTRAKAGLFRELADHRGFERFAHVDEPARKRPTQGWILAIDEQDVTAIVEYDGVHSDARLVVAVEQVPAMRTAKLFAHVVG